MPKIVQTRGVSEVAASGGGLGRNSADAVPERGESRSVQRALAILELIMEHGRPMSIPEVIDRLSIPKSTAYELVNLLSRSGYVSSAGGSRNLFLGRKLFELGMAYRSQVDLLKDGGRVVERLRDDTGETVQLSVLDADLMLVLLKEEGNKPLRIISQIGSRFPVNWAASGRLLVSDLDDTRLRDLLTRTVRPSASGRAKTDIELVMSEIRLFRAQGYGIEVNEANEHAGCVAAPVIDNSGRCIAAISIVVPSQRMVKPNRGKLVDAVCAAATELSRRLGG